MNILRTIFLILFVGFNFSIFSQDLILNYTEPDVLVVCDNNDFTYTMTNASPDTLKNVMVTVNLPIGLNYIAGSITVGSESNIAIPNAPVFSFGNIPPFQTVEFTIGTNLQCALVNEINNGVLFTNTLNANWEGGNNTLTTLPYIIETPLLIITSITNSFLSGTQGSIVERTITIQNTRLGALSSFIFSDFHDGGILITSALGTVINTTNTSWEIELSGNDFMTIGDGDALFEQDEVIVITEVIEITDCGIDLLFTNSDYTVSWGCFGEVCQTEQNNATIDLIPNSEDSNLFIEGFTDMPCDFCGGEIVKQGVWIKNQGTSEALEVNFYIEAASPLSNFINAFDPMSIVQDSNGVVSNITPTISNPAPTTSCNFPAGLFQEALFYWESIPAGDSILLTWNTYICKTETECSQVFPSLNMEYVYFNDCPRDTLTGGVKINKEIQDSLLNELLFDSVFYYFGVPIEDAGTYPIEYHAISNRLTRPGVLDVEFDLPCNFSWVNSDLMMGGVLPNNIDVTTNGAQKTVHAQYDLPMDSNRVMTIFEVAFACDPACGANVGSCGEPYITGIGDVGCGTIQTLNFKLNLRKDNSVPFECGQEVCREIDLIVDCPGDGFPGDFAYLILDHDFERCNYDLPDNDDDRLADATGELDFNLVRKDRTIPGDTVTNIFTSTFDFPAGEFPVDFDQMTVQFESHSMDKGIDGGDFLSASLNAFLLQNGGIQPLNAQIRIVDNSTGNVYECEITTPPNFEGMLDEFFSIVNTEPFIPLDEVNYNKFTYETSIADITCLPPGFQYGQGDSLIFTTKHRMVYNPISQDSTGLPPVLNMRSAIVPIFCDQFNPYISRIPRFFTSFQYSGYQHRILPGRYITSQCESFDGPINMGIRFVLGMDNFFPYEYRPLASLDDWQVTFPNGISVLESELEYLRYWEGNNIIQSQDLVFSQTGNTYNFQVGQFHLPILDESWEMSFYHKFEADCSFEEFSSMLMDAQLTLNECLPQSSNLNLNVSDSTFFSGNPNLNIGVDVAAFFGFDNQAEWKIALLNSEGNNFTNPAENVWVEVISLTGLVTDFAMTETSTGIVINSTNGIFQLGTLNVNELKNYRLTATNNSCDTEDIELRYGWNCTPYSGGGDAPCVDKKIFLSATSPGGELEMEVTSPTGSFDLCEVIDYHTVEIFNAQQGNVYDVLLEITMPQGLSLVPNSTQIAYPTGGTFVAVADPVNIAGNVFQWNLSELNSTIQTSGLGSVSDSPNNSVSLRFLTNTDCGFVAGARIVFKTKGQQNCPDPTNILSKSGDPVEITGINPLYSSDINIAIPNPTAVTCDVVVPLNINILPGGTTSNSDSIFINLPPGVMYVSGSYLPINNAPTNPPTVIDNGGQQVLKLKLDGGLTAGSLVSFEIQTVGYGENGCDNQVVQVQAVQRQDAVCSSTGELCYVLAETGSGSINVSTIHPDLFLQNLEIVSMGDSVNFDIVIGNSGIPNSSDVQVDFYIDNDGDGMLSTGDVLVGNGIYQGTIGTNETINFTGGFDLTPEQLCDLIAVIDEGNNCVCSTVGIPVNVPMSSMLENVIACSGEAVEIGFANATGHTYDWNPSGNITSANAATTIFQASNVSLMDTMFFNYSILDNNGDGCEISHELEVAVLPVPMILQQDVEICAGETITLFATSGGTYNWQGPNILNPNQASQTVTLFEDATYTVDITLPPGCDGMDAINVTVTPLETETSNVEKCPDELVIIGGQNISAAGIYCDTISTLNGCDSVICVEVLNFLSETQEIQAVCPGDSVVVDGISYFPPEVICNTITSAFGCDSIHCISLEYVDEPFAEFIGIDAEIFVAEDEETQLEVTPGFASYEWFPTTGLSCADCHNPTTTLGEDEGLEYRVTITDENGCMTVLFLSVTVLPPCLPTRIQIPNAFTPDGDGVNDEFGVPAFEGFEMVSSIKIFDRWGEKVYQGTGPDAFWDGTIDGKIGTSDVYVYIIRITCDEGEGTLHGDITLIR